MVSKVIRASVLGASASVMAVAAVVLKRRKLSTYSRPREPKFEENDFEEVTKQKESSSIGASSKSRSHRKRSREDGDSLIEVLAGQIGEMANAIKKLSEEKVNTEDLYKEVMQIEGFDEEFLGSVFDHLNANSSLAQGFMVKSHNIRRKWIEKFMTKEWQGY